MEDGRKQGPRGLGRGLSALLDDSELPGAREEGAQRRTLPVAFLKPNRNQPRRRFEEEELKELAQSIREKGVLQPILVRPLKGVNAYEIVAGERRWRAAQLAKLHEVPVVVRTLTDSEALEIAIVENVQRADLNAIEEAGAYRDLMEQFHYTQDRLAQAVGKSRSHIANTLRLLKLPEPVRLLIAEGKLTAGHARALVGTPDPEALANEIVSGSLSVRQAERKAQAPKGRVPRKVAPKDADTRALEQGLSNALGMTVEIEHKGEAGGQVNIHYLSLEQLDEICRRLNFFVEVD
jgi:ParB family transcriptional regulator, chromosome partitioning protein